MSGPLATRLAQIVRERICRLGPGRATVEIRDGYVEVTPMTGSACPFGVCAQSETEISIFVGPPTNPCGMAVDVYDPDSSEVLRRVGHYLDAIFRGEITVIADADGRKGDVTFALDDGERTHHYSSSRRPRSRPERFTYDAY